MLKKFYLSFFFYITTTTTTILIYLPKSINILLIFFHIYIYIYIYIYGATGLLCPWDSPDKNTLVGCHALLQSIFSTWGSNPHLPESHALQVDSLSTELPGKPLSICVCVCVFFYILFMHLAV